MGRRRGASRTVGRAFFELRIVNRNQGTRAQLAKETPTKIANSETGSTIEPITEMRRGEIRAT